VPVRRPDGWWEFKHEKFLKGRSDLLIQIKRADHYEEVLLVYSRVVHPSVRR
jgi:hypothetical protein